MPKSAGTTTCIFMKKPNNISLTPARAEKKYGASLDLLDLDLLLADALKKTREFVFTYPKTRLSGALPSAHASRSNPQARLKK